MNSIMAEDYPIRPITGEQYASFRLVRGYALYASTERWDEPTGLPDGRLVVREVLGADPAATAGRQRRSCVFSTK